MLILPLTAVALGFVHGMGGDHLMAIAALSLQPGKEAPSVKRARALGVAVQFAFGHACLLSAGACLLILLGWTVPIAAERSGELLGGALLIALGAVALWAVIAAHSHMDVGRNGGHPMASVHSHLPMLIGAAFAVSSLRALAMLVPFGGRMFATPLPLMLGLIVAFSAGVLLSMSLFGVAFARVMSFRVIARLGNAAILILSVSSMGLGVYWIMRV